MPEGPPHPVWALAGHFFPSVIIGGQVDQADFLADPGPDFLAGGTGEILLHDGATATSIEALHRSTYPIAEAKAAVGYLGIEHTEERWQWKAEGCFGGQELL